MSPCMYVRDDVPCFSQLQVPLIIRFVGRDGVRVVILEVLDCERKDRLAFGLGVVDSHLDAR